MLFRTFDPVWAPDVAEVAEAPALESFDDSWTMPGDLSEMAEYRQEAADVVEDEVIEEGDLGSPEAPAAEVAEVAEVAEEEAVEDLEGDGREEGVFSLNDLQEYFPGNVLTGKEDFERVVKESSQARRDLEQLNAFLGAYPEATAFYQRLAEAHQKGGADVAAVAREVFASLESEEEPDKYDDPEAWINWRDAQADRTRAQEEAKKAQEAHQARQTRRESEFISLFDEHVKAKGYSEEDADALADKINLFFSGDPVTGAMRQDTIAVLDEAMNMPQTKQAAREEGYKEGYAKAIADKRKASRELTAPPPSLDGSTAQPKKKTPEDEYWDRREKSWDKYEVDLSWEG